MNIALSIVIVFIGGLLLGAVFFAGLWLTVTRMTRVKYPALLFGASFVGRMAMAIGGIYFAGDGDWKKIIACLAGFVIARPAYAVWSKRVSKKEMTK